MSVFEERRLRPRRPTLIQSAEWHKGTSPRTDMTDSAATDDLIGIGQALRQSVNLQICRSHTRITQGNTAPLNGANRGVSHGIKGPTSPALALERGEAWFSVAICSACESCARDYFTRCALIHAHNGKRTRNVAICVLTRKTAFFHATPRFVPAETVGVVVSLAVGGVANLPPPDAAPLRCPSIRPSLAMRKAPSSRRLQLQTCCPFNFPPVIRARNATNIRNVSIRAWSHRTPFFHATPRSVGSVGAPESVAARWAGPDSNRCPSYRPRSVTPEAPLAQCQSQVCCPCLALP